MIRDDSWLLLPDEEVASAVREFPYLRPVNVRLSFAIRALAQHINDGMGRWLAPFGLNASRFNYLAPLFFNRHRGLSARELAGYVHTLSGTTTTMIDALERDGLVARNAHPTDRRILLLRPTAKGRKLFLQAAVVHHQHYQRVLNTLSQEEAQVLLKLLVRLGNALAEDLERDEAVGN
jgi:DNA-binding MarR family transcriptional regulator